MTKVNSSSWSYGAMKGVDAVDYEQTEMFANTWCLMWGQWSSEIEQVMRDFINTCGVTTVIAACSNEADYIVSQVFEIDLLDEPTRDLGYMALIRSLIVKRLGNTPVGDTLKTLLQLLRFGKRLTLIGTDPKETVESFLSNDNRIKLFDRYGLPTFIREGLEYVSSKYFPKYNSPKYKPENYFRYVPKGVTAEGLSTPFEKYLAASALGLVPAHMKLRASWNADRTASRYTTVPKNYKVQRGICEEPLATTLAQGPLADYLTDALDSRKSRFAPGGRVTLHSQTRNQDLCYDASIGGSLSTIDLSSASDSISFSVASAVLPKRVWEDLFVLRSSKTEVNGKVRTLHIVTTMGSRITFPLECHIFWCFGALAIKVLSDLGIGDLHDLENLSVYGDDIIIPTIYTEFLIDLLEKSGFKVNQSKTFTTTTGMIYRESCGKEFVDGVDIASIYWPRKVVKVSDLATMVALQNRLYDAGYVLASDYIKDCVIEEYGERYVPTVLPDSDEFGFHGDIPSMWIDQKAHFGTIAKVEFDRSTQYRDKVDAVRILTDLPCPEECDMLFSLCVPRLVPVWDNTRITVKDQFPPAVTSILPDLFQEFCYIRTLGTTQMSYDDVCALANVVQPRDYMKHVTLAENQYRVVRDSVLIKL